MDIWDSGPRGRPIQLCLQHIKSIFCLLTALKQTKAGPRSSETPFLVLNYTHLIHDILAHLISFFL